MLMIWGGLLFEGNLVANPIGGQWYSGNADDFCKAIRVMSKYEKLEDSFYSAVENLEKWLIQPNTQQEGPRHDSES